MNIAWWHRFSAPTGRRCWRLCRDVAVLPCRTVYRISSSRRRGSDSFLLDQRTPSVLRGLHRTALNCNPNCNFQIRRFLYRHPASFRSVRGLGLVNARCPYGSGAPEDCPSAWLSASLPADDSVTPWSSSPPPGLFPATWPRPVLLPGIAARTSGVSWLVIPARGCERLRRRAAPHRPRQGRQGPARSRPRRRVHA